MTFSESVALFTGTRSPHRFISNSYVKWPQDIFQMIFLLFYSIRYCLVSPLTVESSPTITLFSPSTIEVYTLPYSEDFIFLRPNSATILQPSGSVSISRMFTSQKSPEMTKQNWSYGTLFFSKTCSYQIIYSFHFLVHFSVAPRILIDRMQPLLKRRRSFHLRVSSWVQHI